MRIQPDDTNELQQCSIAMWGPTQSGKDWLIRAFAKELSYYNEHDPDFKYELSELAPDDADETIYRVDPPDDIAATPGREDQRFCFKRIDVRKKNHIYSNTQVHEIIIHNAAGGELVDSLSDQKAYNAAYQALIHAKSIIITLGPPHLSLPYKAEESFDQNNTLDIPVDCDAGSHPEVKAFEEGLYSEDAMSGEWTVDQYLEFIDRLFQILPRNVSRNIAICITKSDQGYYVGNPWTVLAQVYGPGLISLLKKSMHQHSIKVFLTSAAGYIANRNNKGKEAPNFLEGKLISAEKWNPVNAALPFFWIFQQIEMDRLRSGPIIFRNDRMRSYVKYPESRRRVEKEINDGKKTGTK
jgi:hypothetical protein